MQKTILLHSVLKLSAVGLFTTVTLLSCIPKLDSIFYDDELVKATALNSQFANIRLRDEKRIKLGLITDSHQNYEDLENVVDILNSRTDLDGVIHIGDFTNEAMAIEFKYFVDIISRLNKPFYVLPGNHDLIGIGENLYKKSFGPLNHLVSLTNFHLIFFNNNTLDSQVDWSWFGTALNSKGSKASIVFMHINPENEDYFAKNLSDWVFQIAENASTGIFLNGHNHVFQYFQRGNIHIAQISRTERNKYAVLEVIQRANNSFEANLEFCMGETCFANQNLNLAY